MPSNRPMTCENTPRYIYPVDFRNVEFDSETNSFIAESSYEEQKVVCSEFGCRKELNCTEQLYGSRCSLHSKK